MRASDRRKQTPRPRHPRQEAPRREPEPTQLVDVVVLSLAEDSARVRRLDDGTIVRLRVPDLRAIVPALRVSVQCRAPRGNAPPRTLVGHILHARLDLDALALPPRPPIEFGPWPMDDELDHLPDDVVAHLRARARDMFEMHSPPPDDEDILFAALDHREADRPLAAHELLMRLVERDPGNIDAHRHLGNLVFDVLLPVARTHYEIAVQIGERQLGPGFDGILSWYLHGNRAFLRSLHGLGLCQWRGGDFHSAEATFRRMLCLCPEDGIGARFLLVDVRARKLWGDGAEGDGEPPF
ncbi:tetratricopeptide repeat protein [Nannocystis pusilla]|uniref:Tetratricopeptide repeat protein n=1 Tax=Nannocystis pusilla TaxID=889268 RepID=A0ABS7TIA4_9BACT|nr:tetratricopeptide repeat protein [Nannocystis pusilla]MBZ5707851.1 tetratricopeptide repeat protein [Nannocystis pusilla]